MRWRSTRDDVALARLREELDELRAENARLRSDEQRPLSPLAVAADLDRRSQDVGDGRALLMPESDEDLALLGQRYLDVELTRHELMEVCAQLQTLAGQLLRQLDTNLPAAEIDRRVTDRRDHRPTDAHPATVTGEIDATRVH